MLGAMNSENQWWDGKNWKSNPGPRQDIEHIEKLFWLMEKMRGYDVANGHPTGVFKCPRCWQHHYIVDNFDLLCDRCAADILVHPNAPQEQIVSINEWKQKAKLHWSGNAQKEIQERIELRNKLEIEEPKIDRK